VERPGGWESDDAVEVVAFRHVHHYAPLQTVYYDPLLGMMKAQTASMIQESIELHSYCLSVLSLPHHLPLSVSSAHSWPSLLFHSPSRPSPATVDCHSMVSMPSVVVFDDRLLPILQPHYRRRLGTDEFELADLDENHLDRNNGWQRRTRKMRLMELELELERLMQI